jgi:anti-sigma regulatory factor (Ser/Thr protein kinase)
VTVQTSLTFNREPKSVRAARGALDGLDGRFPKARLYDAGLCLSELVSNAIQHPGPGGEVGLTIDLDEVRLRVEVINEGGNFDPGRPTKGDERGWGLFIVDSLSDSWGAEAGERTVVWFEILRAPRDQLGQETTWKAGTSAPST